jgi:hypothetical protein
MLGSVFLIHRNLTQNSVWISYADSRIGNYLVGRRSVIVVSYLSFPRCITLASIRVYVGKTTSRMPNGWNLLRPFTAVKALYLYWGIAPRIAPALQELIGEREEVLPNLQSEGAPPIEARAGCH